MANLLRQFLSKTDLKEVADAIADIERRTSGEVRVAIRQKREKSESGLSVEQLARNEFVRLGMKRTQERTGVLLFILVEAREFFILADEHINEKVPLKTWDAIASTMSSSFAKQAYREGIIAAVKAVGDHLASHFPAKRNDTNELPNEVAVS